jgi:predicted patatin/cPLA2 family phospholipase
VRTVIGNIFKRAEELGRNPSARYDPTSTIRTGIWVAGGGASGIHSASILQVFEEHELLPSNFDVLGGVEAGALNMDFFRSHQMKDALSIYKKEICSDKIIGRKKLRRVIYADVLEEAIRETIKISRIQKCPSESCVAVTDLEGHGELISSKDTIGQNYDAVDLSMASVVPPTVENHPRMIGRKLRVSGILSMPIPILEVAGRFNLTDILVILNEPNIPRRALNPFREYAERLAGSFFIRPLTPGLIKAFINRREIYNRSLAVANSRKLTNGCWVRVVAPPLGLRVSKTCTNRRLLQDLENSGRRTAFELFRRSAD